MNILHTISRIHDTSSGPTYSVTSLAVAQLAGGFNVKIGTTRASQELLKKSFVNVFPAYSVLGKLQISPAMRAFIARESAQFNLIHNHGLWMFPNIYPRYRAPSTLLVCSPRGTMSNWAWNRSRIWKQLFLIAGQRQMLAGTNAFHATASHELDDIRMRGYRQPVAIIPNGIHVSEDRRAPLQSKSKTLLFLARIHQVKGLEMLLEAWSQIEADFPEWELKIAGGGDEKYLHSLKSIVESKRLTRVLFMGPVFGEQKIRLYRDSDLYVLPSFSENFGVSVAEALAEGVPVLTTTATPWSDLRSKQAGLVAEPKTTEIRDSLRQLMKRSRQDLYEMGQNGRQWMQSDFSWESVATKMKEFYHWLEKKSDKPSFVHVD